MEVEQRKANTSAHSLQDEQSRALPLLATTLHLMTIPSAEPPPLSMSSPLMVPKAASSMTPLNFESTTLQSSASDFYAPPQSPMGSPSQSPGVAARDRRHPSTMGSTSKRRLSEDVSSQRQSQSLKLSKTSLDGKRKSGSGSTSVCHVVEPPVPTMPDPGDGWLASSMSSTTAGYQFRESPFDSTSDDWETVMSGIKTANTSFQSVIAGEDSQQDSRSDSYSSSFPSIDDSVDPHDFCFHVKGKSHPSQPSSPRALTGSALEALETVALTFEPAGLTEQDQRGKPADGSSKRIEIVDTPQRQSSVPLEHYQVRDLSGHGLFCGDTSKYLPQASHLSFRVRYEVARIALASNLNIEDLTPKCSDYDQIHDLLETIKRLAKVDLKLPKEVSTSAWEAMKVGKNNANVYLKAGLCFSKDPTMPIFKLALEDPQTDKSCRFHRGFGGDRFLYLKTPNLQFSHLTAHLKGQGPHLQSRFLEWLLMDHSFLGRTWRAFYIKPYKSKSKSEEKSRKPSFEVVLFAMQGDDIPTGYHRSIGELIDWFISLKNKQNRQQPYCKMFSRLSLGFSKTTPTIYFKPSQIRWVKDICADGTPEANEFDDPHERFESAWMESRTARDFNKVSMNDGCSRISLGACRLIYQILGLSGPVPSAFQGRIGGAKGVWIRSAETDSKSEDDEDVWIEINDSQKKFELHDADRHDGTFDKKRLSFDINRHTTLPQASSLHVNFLPILGDRGVKTANLHSLSKTALDLASSNLLDAIEDDVKCSKWIVKNCPGVEKRLHEEEEIKSEVVSPLSTTEKIIFLIQHGFSPKECPYLGHLLLETAEEYFTKYMHNLKIPVPRSTIVMGIADPLGILQPGEIHISFSEPFVNRELGHYDISLHNTDVLVTRHPTLRRSDIQKVRVVNNPALSHLVDVVVFPSKGCTPLASKLQGGDYDGDMFVIIWEPVLVEDFMNAPAPLELPRPESFGIEVDRTTIGEILDGLDPIGNFLRRSFEFRWQPNVLGRCTNLIDTLMYAENDIGTPAVEYALNFHDLVIDAPKNGYICDNDNYSNFVKSVLLLTNERNGLSNTPAYKEFIQNGCKGAIDCLRGRKESISCQSRPKAGHVVDDLLFRVIRPSIMNTLGKLNEYFLAREKYRDEQLESNYLKKSKQAALQIQTSTDPMARVAGTRIQIELDNMLTEFHKVRKFWDRQFPGGGPVFGHPKDKSKEELSVAVKEVYALYDSIVPIDVTLPEIAAWTVPRLPYEPSDWELLKASGLYYLYGVKKPKFVFRMAGKHLAYIKNYHTLNPQQMTERMMAQYKFRKSKIAGVAERSYQAFDT